MNITNIELRHLRYFLAVAEELNFSRAALRLHISQPPLSQQIQEMEARLETQLFVRSKRKVELTKAGVTLLPHAKKLLRGMEDGLWAARSAGLGQTNELRIGTIISAPLVPAFGKILKSFKKTHPEIRLVLQEVRHSQRTKILEENEVDIVFAWQVEPITDRKFCTHILSSDQLYFYLCNEHSLAKKKYLTITDLANEPLLLTTLQTKMPFFYDLQERAQAEGVQLRILEESAHFTVVTNLVAANIGLGILPEYVGRLATQPLIRKTIKGMVADTMKIDLGLLYRSDNKSEVMSKFLARLPK